MVLKKYFLSNNKKLKYQAFYISHRLKVFSIFHLRQAKRTLVTELQSEYNEFYSKDLRYELRRFLRDFRENEYSVFVNEPDIDSIEFFNNHNITGSKLEYGTIQVVSKLKLSGRICIIHYYSINGRKVRLTYSVGDNNLKSQDRGRYNRFLHDVDLQHFKDIGFEEYDWGNINLSSKKLANISSFKLEFGGREIIVFNYIPIWIMIVKKLSSYGCKIR
jgi:hypothetical protein